MSDVAAHARRAGRKRQQTGKARRLKQDRQHHQDTEHHQESVSDDRLQNKRRQIEKHSADDRADVAAAAADDNHEQQQEDVFQAEHRRVDDVIDVGVGDAGEAGERAGQREGQYLGLPHVDAHRGGGVRIVADRAAGAAEARSDRAGATPTR